MTLPLLMLPGMMCDARLFAKQTATLSQSRSIVLAPMVGSSSMQALAANVLAHAPECFALAGLSMGGILAMEVVRQAPERVERLALLDTNPLAEAEERKAIRHEQMHRARSGELREVIRDDMKPNYLSSGPNRQDILDTCMDMALDLGPNVFCEQSLALRDRPDQTTTLRGLKIPTLLLCGKDDTLCPVERHELMHELMPHSRLAVIEGAGHLPTLEQPDAVTHEFKRWLAS